MSLTAEDIYKWSPFSAMQHEIDATAEFTIGNTGAVATTDADDVGITLTRTGTGTYSGAFPPVPISSASASNGRTRISAAVQSAALTVQTAIITAKSPKDGTFTLKTLNGASATDPANGDIIVVYLNLQMRPVP